MTEIFATVRLLLSIGGILVLALLVLLAMPASRLCELVLPFVGWGGTALSALYIVSPIDVLPDVIPVIGWADDLVALCVAVASAMTAMNAGKERRQLH